MAQATMNVRIDENIKKSFDEFCSEVGMNASVAVNMFIRAVLRSRRIPFEITDSANEPMEEALMAEAVRGILLERMREADETGRWIDHATIMDDARHIISSARKGQ